MTTPIKELKEVYRWIPKGSQNHIRMGLAIEALEKDRRQTAKALRTAIAFFKNNGGAAVYSWLPELEAALVSTKGAK